MFWYCGSTHATVKPFSFFSSVFEFIFPKIISAIGGNIFEEKSQKF